MRDPTVGSESYCSYLAKGSSRGVGSMDMACSWLCCGSAQAEALFWSDKPQQLTCSHSCLSAERRLLLAISITRSQSVGCLVFVLFQVVCLFVVYISVCVYVHRWCSYTTAFCSAPKKGNKGSFRNNKPPFRPEGACRAALWGLPASVGNKCPRVIGVMQAV